MNVPVAAAEEAVVPEAPQQQDFDIASSSITQSITESITQSIMSYLYIFLDAKDQILEQANQTTFLTVLTLR